MRDFASLGLWPFPDAIFYLFVGELVEDNWGKLVGFSSVKDFDLIQCNLKSVSIFSYYWLFLGKKLWSLPRPCYSLAHTTIVQTHMNPSDFYRQVKIEIFIAKAGNTLVSRLFSALARILDMIRFDMKILWCSKLFNDCSWLKRGHVNFVTLWIPWWKHSFK